MKLVFISPNHKYLTAQLYIAFKINTTLSYTCRAVINNSLTSTTVSLLFAELLITLGACEDDINPNAHRFRRRRDEKQRPFDGLHAERALGPRTARSPLMVDEHILDGLEPDEGAVGSLLRLVSVVVQTALRSVKDEPAPFPLSDGAAGVQLGQVAVTGACCELHVHALFEVMTSSLDEGAKVQVTVADWQVACQRTRTCLTEYTKRARISVTSVKLAFT